LDSGAQNASPNGINPLRILIKDSTLYEKIITNEVRIPVVNNALSVNYRPNNVMKYPVRIAIDPGHVAGNWSEAYIEGHFIENRRNNIRFYESEIAMATALLLKDKLEKNGFIVFMSRKWKEGSLGKSYTNWFKSDLKKTLIAELKSGNIDSTRYSQLLKSDKKTVFETFYRFLDLQERADKINLFNPDITVLIHYNTSEFTASKGEDAPICDHNYSTFFVPGGFTLPELGSPKQEHDVFRLISTNDIERSARLSDYVAQEFFSNFGVYSLESQSNQPWAQNIPWLKRYVSQTPFNSVLGRNLFLTRKIQSPIVYGEPFLQNNKDVIYQLNNKSLNVNGLKVGPIIQTSAQCYYNGILRYLKEGNFSVVFE
jgi:N-acetylmuramoyl-L-alanine amidase